MLYKDLNLEDIKKEVAAEEAEDCPSSQLSRNVFIYNASLSLLSIVSMRDVTSHEALAQVGVRSANSSASVATLVNPQILKMPLLEMSCNLSECLTCMHQ